MIGVNMNQDMQEIIDKFDIKGTLKDIQANTEGHINSTFISTFDEQGIIRKYTHQLVNGNVFLHPEQVMENIVCVTSHIQQKLRDANVPDKEQRCLTLVPTKKGTWYTKDDKQNLWRTYRYITNVRTFQFLEDSESAYRFGGAVGTFQKQLSDFDGRKLHITIPDFHSMPVRYNQLEQAVAENRADRLSKVQEELSFLMENKSRGMLLSQALKSNTVPLRVTHNDTKMNNILFSEITKEALCVIDLDTVMGGTILFDTGDMIRTGATTAAEDERDLSKVTFNLGFFKAMVEGYFEQANSFLTPYEKELVGESGRTITQIMAVRFLTDYLNGDVYYHIDRSEHNLDRARTQLSLMKDMDRQWEEITHCISRLTV